MIRESDILDHPELFASGPRLVAPPGPIASAPTASENNGLMYYDDTTGKAYISRKKTCKFIDQSSIPHYFCDSVNGSDSNDGLTSATPKKTVAAVSALASGPCVWEFARGSYFREQMTIPSGNYVVKAYGTGDRPVFDCADVVETFTKTVGYTNVWQFTYNNEITLSGKSNISLWFDQIRMIRSTTLAICDSTPGSFYCVTSYSGTDTVYFHSPDSVDPNADGRIYEVAARLHGVKATGYLTNADGAEIYSVHTKRNGGNDGSLLGSKYIGDCYAYDGMTHCIWNGGIAEDCVAERCVDGTAFISYVSTPDASCTFRYTRCSFLGIESALYGWTVGGIAFYHHTAGVALLPNMLYENCSVEYCHQAFAGTNSKSTSYIGCTVENCGLHYYSNARKLNIFSCTSHPSSSSFSVYKFGRFVYDKLNDPNCPISDKISIKGNLIIGKDYSTLIMPNAVITEIISNTFYLNLKNAVMNIVAEEPTFDAESILFFKNIVSNPVGCGYLNCPTEGLAQCNNNLFLNDSISSTYGADNYTTITALKSGESIDLASVIGDPLFTGNVVSGDPSIANNSPANAIGAGVTNYVPTNEELYAGNVWDEL